MFGLTSQLRRASVSIPSNIAEGHGRATTGEFKQFLGIASGSVAELQTQLIIARGLRYSTDELLAECDRLAVEVSKMMTAFALTLKTPNSKQLSRTVLDCLELS